jgi:hypothetical protein
VARYVGHCNVQTDIKVGVCMHEGLAAIADKWPVQGGLVENACNAEVHLPTAPAESNVMSLTSGGSCILMCHAVCDADYPSHCPVYVTGICWYC